VTHVVFETPIWLTVIIGFRSTHVTNNLTIEDLVTGKGRDGVLVKRSNVCLLLQKTSTERKEERTIWTACAMRPLNSWEFVSTQPIHQ